MTIERESVLNKIRALLAKTMENGCSEAEAMAALGKAQAMKDAYAVTEAELNLTKEEEQSSGANHRARRTRIELSGSWWGRSRNFATARVGAKGETRAAAWCSAGSPPAEVYGARIAFT